jgi:hypothetical protein
VDGRPLPAGWLGKPWASAQGAERARGRWLLFTDADIRFHPEAVGAALGFARRRGRGGCTLTPRLECASFWERVVQPAATLVIGSFIAPPALSERPRVPIALAAGGFMLLERDLYERAGGHAAVRDRVADDLALARAVKRAGGLLALGYGDELLSVRMYHGHRELWRGWRKNAAFGLPGGSGVAAAGALLVLLAAITPPLALALSATRREPGLAARGAAALVALTALRESNRRFAPTPRRYAASTPLGLAWLGAVALTGVVDRVRGGPRWRGRRYPHAR